MRIGVITFPGSLDDHDARRAVRLGGAEAVSLWHGEHDLKGVDAIVLPTVARVPTVDECLTELVAPSVELGRLTAFVNPLAMAAVSVRTSTATTCSCCRRTASGAGALAGKKT